MISDIEVGYVTRNWTSNRTKRRISWKKVRVDMRKKVWASCHCDSFEFYNLFCARRCESRKRGWRAKVKRSRNSIETFEKLRQKILPRFWFIAVSIRRYQLENRPQRLLRGAFLLPPHTVTSFFCCFPFKLIKFHDFQISVWYKSKNFVKTWATGEMIWRNKSFQGASRVYDPPVIFIIRFAFLLRFSL